MEPRKLAWNSDSGEGSSSDDEELSNEDFPKFSPSLLMAVDIDGLIDPVKIRHERMVHRTKTLLAANAELRRLSIAETRQMANFEGLEEEVMERRRLQSDSSLTVPNRCKRRRSAESLSSPKGPNSAYLAKKRVSFNPESLSKTISYPPEAKILKRPMPISRSFSSLAEIFSNAAEKSRSKDQEDVAPSPVVPILRKRRDSEPMSAPQTHMEFSTFKAWRRGRRMSQEAEKALREISLMNGGGTELNSSHNQKKRNKNTSSSPKSKRRQSTNVTNTPSSRRQNNSSQQPGGWNNPEHSWKVIVWLKRSRFFCCAKLKGLTDEEIHKLYGQQQNTSGSAKEHSTEMTNVPPRNALLIIEEHSNNQINSENGNQTNQPQQQTAASM